MFASWLPPARLSRALRVAVLLPVTHALVVAARVAGVDRVVRFVSDRASRARWRPTFRSRGGGRELVRVHVVRLFVARRRDWLHGFLILALSELLLLGLWLPVGCAWSPSGAREWWSTPSRSSRISRVACYWGRSADGHRTTFAAAAMSRPAVLLRARRKTRLVAVLFALALAIAARASASVDGACTRICCRSCCGDGRRDRRADHLRCRVRMASYRARRELMRRKRNEGVIVDDDRERGGRLRDHELAARPSRRAAAVRGEHRGATVPISGAYLAAALPPRRRSSGSASATPCCVPATA